jgi:hypothetical protein
VAGLRRSVWLSVVTDQVVTRQCSHCLKQAPHVLVHFYARAPAGGFYTATWWRTFDGCLTDSAPSEVEGEAGRRAVKTPQHIKDAARCSVCGLITDKLQGTPPRCVLAETCRRVKAGESLGGKAWPSRKPWSTDDLPEPPPVDYRGEKPPKRKASELLNIAPEEWELRRITLWARGLA